MGIPAGHLVSAPKWIFTHVGLSLGDGFVFHNNPERGEHVSSLADFGKGKPISLAGQLEPFDFHKAVQNLASVMKAPKAYHPTDNNCEQSLNRLLGRPAISPQLQFWALISALLAGLGVAAYIASRK